MSNPKFDLSVILPTHLALLQEVADGKTHWRKDIVFLNQRKLTENDGLYNVKLTGKGQLALQGVMSGCMVRVTEQYKLDILHGAIGTVEDIQTHMVDSDGIDEYGYVIKRAMPSTTALVRFKDHHGQWCFYNVGDLIGCPAGIAVTS